MRLLCFNKLDLILRRPPTGRANARPMTGSVAVSKDGLQYRFVIPGTRVERATLYVMSVDDVAADSYDRAFVSKSPSLRPTHSVVGAWIRIVIRMAMKVTDAIICAPGALMPTSRPAKAAGMTPVSRVQHMNSISAKLQRARRSGNAHKKTVAGRATSIKMVTTITPPHRC